MYLLVKPTFHSIGDEKRVKEGRNRSFGDTIFWNNVRRLILKMAELEGIDASAGPLKIASFLAVVPMVVLWGMLGTSASNALKLCFMSVWNGVPSCEYAFKDPEKGHENQPDYRQVGDDDDGNVHR